MLRSGPPLPLDTSNGDLLCGGRGAGREAGRSGPGCRQPRPGRAEGATPNRGWRRRKLLPSSQAGAAGDFCPPAAPLQGKAEAPCLGRGCSRGEEVECDHPPGTNPGVP